MDKLISYKAAIDAMGRAKWAIDRIKELPSAEPELIRCKDCEYFHKSFCEIWSKFGTIQTRENGYCYMAERRTDESD